MPSTLSTAVLTILAQQAPTDGQDQSEGFDPFLLIMLVVFGLLIFMMFRRGKKSQQQQQQKRDALEPGQEVMTTMGLFGTVVDIDRDENKVLIEISPGNTATVHIQAIGQIVESTESDGEPADSTTGPAIGADEYGQPDPRDTSDTTPSFNPEDPRGDSEQK